MEDRKLYLGSYIFYDEFGTMHHGAEYGLSENEASFIEDMRSDMRREYPNLKGFEGSAWVMSRKGMQAIARIYTQRYLNQEHRE